MNYLFCAKFMPDKALASPQAVIKSYYFDCRAAFLKMTYKKRAQHKILGNKQNGWKSSPIAILYNRFANIISVHSADIIPTQVLLQNCDKNPVAIWMEILTIMLATRL